MKYSFIIPVYNRPEEIDELLYSMCNFSRHDFEIIVVEDGSTLPCKTVVEKYRAQLPLQYYAKTNSGPGQSRNYGVAKATGEYVLILDSDIVLPKGYLDAIDQHIQQFMPDAFGGPDCARDDFTPIQKAINYAMTSFFTTGGIRGGKKKMDKFYPRSFNMGIRRTCYDALHGFAAMRFGEDIDFSTRLFQAGYKVQLIPEAWVWHKRRTDFRKFFKQVHNSGIARIHLSKRHPGTLKLVHLLPALFTLGCLGCIFLGLFFWWAWLPIIIYALLIFVDASIQNKNLWVGLLSIPAAFIQLIGYGSGFLIAWWKRHILKSGEFNAFENNFYN